MQCGHRLRPWRIARNKNQFMQQEKKEGPVATAIEEQTAKLPSDLFLWAAIGAMAGSAIFRVCKKKQASLFIGQWAAPFLLLGIYNKLVKIGGHDGSDQDEEQNESPNMREGILPNEVS